MRVNSRVGQAGVKAHLHDGEVAVANGVVKREAAVAVFERVRRAVALQQQPHELLVALARREVQRGAVVVVTLVHIHLARLQNARHSAHVARGGGVDERDDLLLRLAADGIVDAPLRLLARAQRGRRRVGARLRLARRPRGVHRLDDLLNHLARVLDVRGAQVLIVVYRECKKRCNLLAHRRGAQVAQAEDESELAHRLAARFDRDVLHRVQALSMHTCRTCAPPSAAGAWV